MIHKIEFITRESKFNKSRFDFKINNNIYLEVKMPLQTLQISTDRLQKIKKETSFNSTDRLIKHLCDLSLSSLQGNRIILVVCFVYPNSRFSIISQSKNYKNIQYIVSKSIKSGLEIWQANFKINKKSILMTDLFEITSSFRN